MMQYVKDLEDQLLADNFPVAVELLRRKEEFDKLFEKLYVTTVAITRLADEYDKAQSTLPDQKYGVDCMKHSIHDRVGMTGTGMQ